MNRLRKVLIVFCMLLFCNTLYAFSYEATFEGDHPMSQYATADRYMMYADNRIFYIRDTYINSESKIWYEDLNTGGIYTANTFATSSISPKNYTFYQIYDAIDSYIVVLRERSIYGWGMDFVIKRVSKDFSTTHFEYRVLADFIKYLQKDSAGNLYFSIGVDSDDGYQESIYKISSKGVILWTSSIPDQASVGYALLDTQSNLIVYATKNYVLSEIYFSKDSGSKTIMNTSSLKYRVGDIFEANSEYIIYSDIWTTKSYYYVDRVTKTERKIEMGGADCWKTKLFRASDNSKIAVTVNQSYLAVYHYDTNYNLTHSYTHNLNAYIGGLYMGGSTLADRVGVIAADDKIYIHPSVSATTRFRVILSKEAPTLSSWVSYEYIGDNTDALVSIAYDLKGNKDYIMNIYNRGTQSLLYSGNPISSLTINVGEGDHYFQTILANNKKSVESNIVHINKRNLLNRAYAALFKGKEQYLILDDANRYYENNTANQRIVSSLKSNSNGVFVISNDVSPVLTPLLEK